MSAEFDANISATRFAVRGAAGIGLTVLLIFVLSAWYATATGRPQANYFLVAGPICGIVGGLAYGRRLGLPVVLALTFGLVGSMFLMQDARSNLLIDVVVTGFVSAFLFWIVGACATLALPANLRFDGARAFAIPGGVAGMVFQFLYGPAHTLFDLDRNPWWRDSSWEQLILWLIAGIGGGWLFGSELDRLHGVNGAPSRLARRSRWAVISVAAGLLGIGIGAACFVRYALPLGLLGGVSPASAAADWLWSWGLAVAATALIALIQTFRKMPELRGRSWAIVGMILALALVFTSTRLVANPWKTRFNTGYAAKLLGEHGHAGDPDYPYAIYTGNLILAQTALDNDDVAASGRYLLEAATTTGFRNIQEKGPDTSVARGLLQRGDRDTVLEYFHRCRNFWPQGIPLINRWESTIRSGRQPNFNNRVINPPDTSSAGSARGGEP